MTILLARNEEVLNSIVQIIVNCSVKKSYTFSLMLILFHISVLFENCFTSVFILDGKTNNF